MEDAIAMAKEEVDDRVSTPATKRLFDVDEDAEKLVGKQADLFHSIVAKLLYVCKRSRPDIETTVAFLCTRVAKSDIFYWKNC